MAESDEEYEHEIHSGIVESLVNKCRNFVPNSSKSSIASIKATLLDARTIIPNISDSNSRTLRSSQKYDKSIFEEHCRDISNDFANIHKKLDKLLDSFFGVVDVVESMEQRVAALEESRKMHTCPPQSYAAATTPTGLEQVNTTDDRLRKLEYQSSEEDRRKRLLQVSVTHPSIDSSSNNLSEMIKLFFSEKMKMANREIDQNSKIQSQQHGNCYFL